MHWVAALALIVFASALPPGGTFIDDDGNPHEGAIEAIAAIGVTRGCNPPANDRFCPRDSVNRGTMAAFIDRALGLPNTNVDFFVDDDTSIFEPSINRLAAAGITRGCNPPANDRFCPGRDMTRGAMAAMLNRAFAYPASHVNRFTDDDGHLFENDIQAFAAAGITLGCNPPANTHYCPDATVTRDTMATFLMRALGLTPMPPPEREVPLPGNPDGDYPVPVEAREVDTSSPDIVIGDGTPQSCTSQAVVSAVAQGGIITFDCGPDHHTIVMSDTAKVFNDTGPEIVIDGGGLVTLSD